MPLAPSTTRQHLALFLLLCGCAQVMAGCASTTLIMSEPEGAHVTLDGRVLGQTPIRLKLQPWVWRKHQLTFSHEGYQDERAVLGADVYPAAVILYSGLCLTLCLWPLPLYGKVPPRVDITLQPGLSGARVIPALGPAARGFQERPMISLAGDGTP